MGIPLTLVVGGCQKTRYIDFERPIVIIYYDDNTVDAINLYEDIK